LHPNLPCLIQEHDANQKSTYKAPTLKAKEWSSERYKPILSATKNRGADQNKSHKKKEIVHKEAISTEKTLLQNYNRNNDFD
jgi:hypothetical protein